MLENENLDVNAVNYDEEIGEIVSDLLYTLFATLDEYASVIQPNENDDGRLTKMSAYIDSVMRKYVKDLYNIDLEPSDYDYMSPPDQ